MVGTACAAGHKTITKINQTAERDKRKKNSLFQSDTMRAAGFLFQNASFADMRAQAHVCFLEKN